MRREDGDGGSGGRGGGVEETEVSSIIITLGSIQAILDKLLKVKH